MKTLNRRSALASLGLFGGSALLGGCAHQASGEFDASTPSSQLAAEPAAAEPPPWKYVKLDPYAVAEVTYEMYTDGGCMYAVVGGVMGALAEKVGEPFRSFPVSMMRYGNGGMGGMGSVCGVVNGCAALIGLFENKKEKERREQLITGICTWYENTPLPVYEPSKPVWADEATPSVSNSILCHVAVANWCQVTGRDVKCVERKERCRRTAADGAIRVVDLLNRNLTDPNCECIGVTSEVKGCIVCHGPNGLKDSKGRMNCGSCHSFEGKHP